MCVSPSVLLFCLQPVINSVLVLSFSFIQFTQMFMTRGVCFITFFCTGSVITEYGGEPLDASWQDEVQLHCLNHQWGDKGRELYTHVISHYKYATANPNEGAQPSATTSGLNGKPGSPQGEYSLKKEFILKHRLPPVIVR